MRAKIFKTESVRYYIFYSKSAFDPSTAALQWNVAISGNSFSYGRPSGTVLNLVGTSNFKRGENLCNSHCGKIILQKKGIERSHILLIGTTVPTCSARPATAWP